MGCVDETQTLRGHWTATEGTETRSLNHLPEIFLQVKDLKRQGRTVIITGLCIIGRNPSLHPGDIRVVVAVDNPELHHLTDVVVFPSTGDRPVPKMLSGGDLDGDDFFVIWDKDLIPRAWNYNPLKFESEALKSAELDHDVGVDDLKKSSSTI